jgi:predicted amino acid dehydrogenase
MRSEEWFERVERQMEFIVNQQAQFSIDMDHLRETQVAMQGQIGKLNEATVAIVGMMGKLAEAQTQLTEAQTTMDARLTEAQAQTEAALKELTTKTRETDERLNILITMFERHLSEQHHIKSASDEAENP